MLHPPRERIVAGMVGSARIWPRLSGLLIDQLGYRGGTAARAGAQSLGCQKGTEEQQREERTHCSHGVESRLRRSMETRSSGPSELQMKLASRFGAE